MATTKSTKAATTKATKAAPAVQAPAAPAANPMAAVAATLAAAPAAPAAPAKVHELAVAGQVLKAANHVATFKGVKGVPANMAQHTYTIGAKAYAPAQGHVNAAQWQAVTTAIKAHGGKATVQQISAAFADAGLPAGLAASFVAYRAKAGSLQQA